MHDVFNAFLVSLAFDVGRYALIATPVFFLLWRWQGERLRARWLRPAPPDAVSMRREIVASLRTATIFAGMGALVYAGARAGVLHVYRDVARYGLAYALLTPVMLIVLQDTYFYFTHRLMHHRLLFRAVHLEHHLSRHTSPFTAYAFSPLEALVHAAFVPLVTLVLPAHEISVFAFLIFMLVRNVLGHAGVELYPAGFVTSFLGAPHTTATHHALHHQRPTTNFGLYFTFWDRVLATTDATYEARFAQVTRAPHTAMEVPPHMGVR